MQVEEPLPEVARAAKRPKHRHTVAEIAADYVPRKLPGAFPVMHILAVSQNSHPMLTAVDGSYRVPLPYCYWRSGGPSAWHVVG